MSAPGPSDDELQSALDRLKEQGCNLLVTGAVPDAVRFRATQRLLGASTADRKRILVSPDATADIDRSLPEGVTPESPDVELIDWTSHSRKTASACVSSIGPDADDLHWLRTAITDAVVSFEAVEGSLGPSELRLAFDSLDVLFEAHADREVCCLIRAVTVLVRGVNGLSHFHFPAEDDTHISDLEPLFDARVELRQRQANPEQRWHVPTYGPTEWMRL